MLLFELLMFIVIVGVHSQEDGQSIRGVYEKPIARKLETFDRPDIEASLSDNVSPDHQDRSRQKRYDALVPRGSQYMRNEIQKATQERIRNREIEEARRQLVQIEARTAVWQNLRQRLLEYRNQIPRPQRQQ